MLDQQRFASETEITSSVEAHGEDSSKGFSGGGDTSLVRSLPSLLLQRPSIASGRSSSTSANTSCRFSESIHSSTRFCLNRTVIPEAEIIRSSAELERDSKLLAINRLRFDSIGLFGRDEEIAVLKACLQRLRQTRSAKHDEGGVDASTTTTTSSSHLAENVKDRDTFLDAGRREFVFISGPSGTGKTSLSANLKWLVQKTKGVWVHGKYDLSLRDQQPLAGIGTICNELCRVVY
jgi:hypothetical protein